MYKICVENRKIILKKFFDNNNNYTDVWMAKISILHVNFGIFDKNKYK
jgi:hypothetical protein